MDIKELLTKYINHVGEMEGTDFLPRNIERKNISKHPFTLEELETLWECSGWDEKNSRWREWR